MSILIKGMEMPKSCYDCRFHEVYGYEDGERRVCELNWEVLFGDEWGKNFKHPDCPLISVPDHGDLIDRDMVLEKAWDVETFVDAVKYAPTIIAADKDGE